MTRRRRSGGVVAWCLGLAVAVASGLIRPGVAWAQQRVDGAVITGLTSRDAQIGFTAGITRVFRGFEVWP